ncbi:MAG: NADH-quinone oxidoreductase subunit C/D [Myxococcaceae bacterium]|nr:NADH-quinone oxidoreductase subunit C/D [Myxococcaceae bacterium]MBH2006415.1 NADH-quinone oxidoreductase subunit C/D [Myxococcaceae bacterium]
MNPIVSNLEDLLKTVDRFQMLYDITAIDETAREHTHDYTLVYHFLNLETAQFDCVKVPVASDAIEIPSLCGRFKNAEWYEREVFDLFGLRFSGHPDLRRILMPESWVGHPLRKSHPARATEMAPYQLPDAKQDYEQGLLRYRPKDEGGDYLYLNLGPQHPGTHGVLRLILKMDGERIEEVIPDIGYHHRGAEKMAERQTWHTYIPYTDRIDYLSGVMNNLAYLLSVEQLAGMKIPERAQVIRVMLCELFRIASHLVWYGTFVQDIGAMSPVFYLFTDRERILEIVEGITGGRMHPSWFRIGGVAQDLPEGWEKAVRGFLDYFPARLREYDRLVMKNLILKKRTIGVGAYNTQEAIDWGVTGAGLRATGLGFDLRKAKPYSGYENFDFDVPIASHGDCYDRALVRIEEMRQSMRIIEQCLNHMPSGPYKSDHPLTTPPPKDKTLVHIETLINHFLNTSWGPVMPAGESFHAIEASKGTNAYYLVSTGGTHAYRARIRTPSFAHMQMVPLLAKGSTLSDLMAILGSIDFVLADLDR